jgi:CheY-like chemotaxis protein
LNARSAILVVTEVATDATLVRDLLSEEFSNVFVSTDPERAVQDFEKHRPAVLILAFNTLEKAERYYLGLYRLSTVIHGLPHRTVILCNKDDLKRVFELCKKEYFNDYVLFWPASNDVARMQMTVHHALSQMVHSDLPGASEIAGQARRLAELETQLDQYAANGGKHMAHASATLQQAEHGLGAALDQFSRKLSEGAHANLVEVRDRVGLENEFKRLKTEEIDARFQSVANAVAPMREWAGALKDNLAPQLESARALQVLAERVRPNVLAVDDDEYQCKLLGHLLADAGLDLSFAVSGTDALAYLSKHRPDLIFMDINLPDIDGVEVTRRIKAVTQFAAIPIIMITGNSEKSVVVESLRAGASDFVVKPFNKDILRAKLNKYLSVGRSQ